MSDHKCEVVPIKLEPHPNADSLSVVTVFDGWTTCVKTDMWEGKTMGAFIPPDSIVPDTEQFAFLGGHRRIRAKKLRGVVSYGLLVPAPEGYNIGDDVAAVLGVEHYEPGVIDKKLLNGDAEADPPIPGPKYDIENYLKYGRVMQELARVATEEGRTFEITLTEKIHGTNARFSFQEGRMWCGSRQFWRKQNPDCMYWRALAENSWIEEFCRANEGAVLYGEIYGYVQKLKYGATKPGQIMFRAFDVFKDGKFMDWPDGMQFPVDPIDLEKITVPVLYRGPFDHEEILKHMNGKSTLADHIREGVVIKPTKEHWDKRLGRVILKAVSPDYLENVK